MNSSKSWNPVMASRKLFSDKEDENEYETNKSPWSTVEETSDAAQKKSGREEDDISVFYSTKTRDQFSYENQGYVMSEETKDYGVKVRPKKGKRLLKKKGTVSEAGLDSKSGNESMETGLENAESGSSNNFWKSLGPNGGLSSQNEYNRRPGRIVATTFNLMENMRRGNNESEDESASIIMGTMVSTPTAQRQSVSWSPSPIARRGKVKLPPLPAFLEESSQQSSKWHKPMESGEQSSKDAFAVQQDKKKKKRKRKQIVKVNTLDSGGDDTMGEAFELSLLRSDTTIKRKKKKKGTGMRREDEESTLGPAAVEREKSSGRPGESFTGREPQHEPRPKVFQRTFSVEGPTHKASDNSSGSEAVGGGTYSISPKKDGRVNGDATDDEESDAILDDDQVDEGKSGRGGEEGEEEEGGGVRRGSKLLTIEQLGLGAAAESHPVCWEISSSGDVIWSIKEALLWEKDAYFYPSSRRVPIEERLPPGCHEPSFLDGDGILPMKPLISTANLARLENRLLLEGNRNWFGEDGELLTLPNPIRFHALRPPHIPLSSSTWDLPAGLQTEYRPAMIEAFGKGYEDSLCEIMIGDVELGRGVGLSRSKRRRGCLLEVEILSVEFTHHPLFSKEHVLAQRVVSLWAEWESRRKAGKAQMLADKVETMRGDKRKLVALLTQTQKLHVRGDNSLDKGDDQRNAAEDNTDDNVSSDNLPENTNSLKEQLHFKLESLRKARLERDSEGKADRKTLESLLFAWRDLKLLRQEQGYATTPLRLHITAESMRKRRKKLGSTYGYASDVSGGEDVKATLSGRSGGRDQKGEEETEGIVSGGGGGVSGKPVKPKRRVRRQRSVELGEGDSWLENEVNENDAGRMRNIEETSKGKPPRKGREAVEGAMEEELGRDEIHGIDSGNNDLGNGSNAAQNETAPDGDLTHRTSGDDGRESVAELYAGGDTGKKRKKKKKKRNKDETEPANDSIKIKTDSPLGISSTVGIDEAGAVDINSPIDCGNLTNGGPVPDGLNQSDEKRFRVKMSSRERRRERLKSFYLAELSAAMELSGVDQIPENVGDSRVNDVRRRPIPAPRKFIGSGDEVMQPAASDAGRVEESNVQDEGEEVEELNEEDVIAAELMEWQNELDKEMEERLEEVHAEWELEMQQYRVALEEWESKRESFKKNKQKRRQKRLKDRAKERHRHKKSDRESLTETLKSDDDDEESAVETNEEDWMEQKPQPPHKVDPRVIRFEVEEMMNASRRPPGEPRLIFKLLRDTTDNTKMTCPKEKERRFAVELTEIQARIFYNGQEACRSKPIPITQTFMPTVDHGFAIRGLGPPSSLAIELFERVRGHSAAGSGVGGWYPMALVHLPIPSRKSVLSENTLPERLEFGNDKVVVYPHAAVGSGVFFSPFPEGPDFIEEDRTNLCLHLSGGIWCRLGWGVNQDGIVLSPRGYGFVGTSEEESKREEEIKSIGMLLMMLQRGAGRSGWNSSKNGGMERLRQLAEDAKSKASSPANDEIFRLIEEWSLSRLERREHFRLDPLMEEFRFVGDPRWRSEEGEKRDGEEWWAVSKRLRVLHLRDKGIPEFRNLRCVPLNDREIPQDVFTAYENRMLSRLTHKFSMREDLDFSMNESPSSRLHKDVEEKFPSESDGCDPHEGRRDWGRKFLREARARLLQQSHLARKQQKRLSDLVIEEQVPTMGRLGMTLLERLKPKRPLKPMRRSWLGSQLASSGLGGTGGPNPPGSTSREVQVKVNVVRAFGVPIRRDIDPVIDSGPWNSPSSSSRPWQWESQQSQVFSEQSLSEVLVRPFVEVALGSARARTTTALGANPTWNEEVQLMLNLETSLFDKAKDQNAASSIVGVLDHTGDDLDAPAWWTSNGDIDSVEDLHLSILLKDETVVDLLVDNSAREAGEVHHATQRHFLASLRIPMSTLRFNHRIEGTFRLSSPPVLLGYTRDEMAFGSGQYSGASRLLPFNSFPGLQPGAIYLTLFITVQPPLPALQMAFEDEHSLESIELPHVESHLRAWEAEVFSTVNHGCCPPKALVPDLGGRTVCVTRFFRPLPPPPGLPMMSKRGSGVVAADWLARFVAMIPLSNGHQLTDIWLNSEQMLRLLCGSRVDHAVLLACLLMHLGLEVWCALGSGLPDGPNCAFVLTKGCGRAYNEKIPTKSPRDRGKSPELRRSASQRGWRDGNEQTSGEEDSEEYENEYDSELWVWDPITGQRFTVRDPFCPLQHLWCLVNDQNVSSDAQADMIWANVQRDDQPQHMNFNVDVRRDWWPAFSHVPQSGGLLSFLPRWISGMGSGSNPQIQAPPSLVGSVQPETLPYESRAASLVRSNRKKGGKRKGKDDRASENNPDSYLKLLEEKIENHLQSCVMHWRKNHLTTWNRHGSSLLRKLLPRLEHPIVGPADHSLDESHLWELKSLMSSHKVCGFPINVPYDGVASAREALRTTGVHTINEPGVEFALAVYLHPYCGIKGESSSVLSLWVYVASLVSRRANLEL